MTPTITPKILEITLGPGDFYFGGQHTRIRTLLGSCVAITLWHPVKRIGGMCHYMLPSRKNHGKHATRLSAGHFADEALELFMQEIRNHQTRPEDYLVKLFGGSDMFDTQRCYNHTENIGNANINAGLSLLQHAGFDLAARDLGGTAHRKIYFELWNGDVWVQHGPLRFTP